MFLLLYVLCGGCNNAMSADVFSNTGSFSDNLFEFVGKFCKFGECAIVRILKQTLITFEKLKTLQFFQYIFKIRTLKNINS